MNLREEVPVNIVKWARLERTINDLFNNFEAWEQKNAELVNKFFDQPYFRWEESLINKLIQIEPSIKFDDIKDEWINLALLTDTNWMWEFNDCMNKISNDEIKRAFIQEIFDKVQNEIWTWAPYTDFPTECPIPGDTNILWYLQTITTYLSWKEWATHWKKSIEILKKIDIKNENINGRLTTNQIPTWVALSSSSIPTGTKNDFDKLLSFEIGKEADRTIDIAQDISNKLDSLFTNSIPAINTVIWENNELKFDESKLWTEYTWALETINNDTNLSDEERANAINDLKREYYLRYLKSKNQKIWNALEELYHNDFDYSKLDSAVLDDYLDKVTDMRLRMLFDNGMSENLKLNFGNLNQFSAFYKWLAKKSINTIQLDPSRWITLPVEKTIVEWPHPRLKKDINQFWENAKSYDALPITYKIKKSDINNLPIDLEDKTKLLNFLSRFKNDEESYTIEWENIWVLIYLFFIINTPFPITKFNLDKQKDIENLFWKAENHNETDEEWKDNNEEDENWEENNQEENNQEENNEWNVDITPEQFKERLEQLWPWKFENWSELWLPVWNSELPGWWYQRMKIKLSDINMTNGTFKWKVSWWELKFKDSIEWKTKEFKMNKEFFSDLEGISKDSKKIRLLPNPDKTDFNSFRNSLNNKLWTSNLCFPIDWVTWDNNKFMQKIRDENWNEKDVEVKYFWASADDKSTYNIKYNPNKRSFTVSSTYNQSEKWKDWKPKTKRLWYKRDMDWNNFLIFFTQKWLHPQTEEESNNAIQRQDKEFKMVNGGHWKLNRFSINNIKNWFKDIFGAIKKKIDEYDKTQTEKFRGIVEGPLLNTMSKLPLRESMKYAVWERQQEIYNERDNAVWKKIEWYLKVFQADPDFWTTFEEIPPHAKTQWWKSLKDIVTDRVWKATDRMGDPWIYQAAALLLANIEKWWSPYRWLAGEENSGLWVTALLWKAHYEQFMRDKQKCINDLKNAWKEKDQIQDVLATCEMDYIINNVSWANWKLKYFGSHEDRWIPGKDWTKYIDNPSKRILSNQFADKLKASYKWRFNKSAVEEAYGKITHNDFNLAKEDFKRLIKSSRFPWALGNLKKMFLLAKNDEQKTEYQKCFLIYMLSGILDVNGKKDLRKQAYLWAKTMWFLPWMLAKNTCHSEQVATLLNDFDWDFSNSIKSYFHASDLKNWKLKIEALINEVDSRWTVDRMNKFEKYSKSDFLSKEFPENSVLKELQTSALKTDVENIDDSLLDNPLVANSWWLLSNVNVVRNRMDIRDWEFSWKDNDEKNNKKEFWEKIAKEVEGTTVTTENIKLLLKQYCEWFQIYDKEKTYRWIKTAYRSRDLIWKSTQFKNDDDTWDNMGRISQREINSIIWYTFQWTVMSDHFSWRRLPKEMKMALAAFQNKFKEAFDANILNDPSIVSSVFGIENEWNIQPLFLWSWDVYNRTVTWREYTSDDDDKKEKNRIKRHFTSWNFINYDIANMEKRLKNLSSGDYEPVTISSLDSLYDKYRAIE